jgi:hypothetical protein
MLDLEWQTIKRHRHRRKEAHVASKGTYYIWAAEPCEIIASEVAIPKTDGSSPRVSKLHCLRFGSHFIDSPAALKTSPRVGR